MRVCQSVNEFFPKLVRPLLLGAGIAASLLASTALASERNPLEKRENEVPPAILYLQSQGVTLTYLGEEGGMQGYLAESPNGRMQTFYVAPDGKHVVVGLLFEKGLNVTGLQIEAMKNRFNEAQRQLAGDMELATPVEQAEEVVAPQEEVEEAPVLDQPEVLPDETQGDAPVSEMEGDQDGNINDLSALDVDIEVLPEEEVTLEEEALDRVQLPEPPEADDVIEEFSEAAASPWLSDLDQQEFVDSVANIAWFSVGHDTAPVVYMVADPQCPYCHAAWNRLRPHVVEGDIQLRIIMIAGLEGSEPLARSILGRPDPGRAWLQGEGSIAGMTVQDPPEEGSEAWNVSGRYLSINESFARSFGITGTPFLAYVGNNGRLYSSSGLPEDHQAFLSALF